MTPAGKPSRQAVQEPPPPRGGNKLQRRQQAVQEDFGSFPRNTPPPQRRNFLTADDTKDEMIFVQGFQASAAPKNLTFLVPSVTRRSSPEVSEVFSEVPSPLDVSKKLEIFLRQKISTQENCPQRALVDGL